MCVDPIAMDGAELLGGCVGLGAAARPWGCVLLELEEGLSSQQFVGI